MVLVYTNIYSIYDNASDAAKLKDLNWRQTVAQRHAMGLARAFNLQRTSSIYRVIVDGTQIRAYSEEANILSAVQRNLGSASKIVVEKV